MDLDGPGRDVQVVRQSPYPEEFRRDAVALYRAGGGKRTYAAVAAELGITGETLRTMGPQGELYRVSWSPILIGSGGLRDLLLAPPEGFLVLGWRYVVERGVETLLVVPGDPLEDRSFDLVDVLPGALHLDQLGLEGAVQGLGHRVVIAVRDGADRRGGAEVGEPVGVPN